MTVSAARLNRLEAERFDISYKLYPFENVKKERAAMKRRAKAQADLEATERQIRAEELEQAKKTYFNAGRYFAGARDVTATKAFALIESDIV
jgi:hypothetical protein